MRPLTEPDIRASFVNCSKGEAKRMALPRDLATRPWPDLDFLGWRDPGALDRAHPATAMRSWASRCGSRRSSAASCTATCARCA